MCRAFLQEDPDITEEEIVEELNLLSFVWEDGWGKGGESASLPGLSL